VLTARCERPRQDNSLENDDVSWMRGRSSAMAHSVRTLDKLTPRFRKVANTVGFISLVHSSMTPYEQKVSRTVRHTEHMVQWITYNMSFANSKKVFILLYGKENRFRQRWLVRWAWRYFSAYDNVNKCIHMNLNARHIANDIMQMFEWGNRWSYLV
jgi:hypothetical protein